MNDILTFDYEDNNLLGSDANTTLEDLLRNLELFNLGRTNRERSERDGLHVNGFFNMAQEFDEGRGAGNKLTVWDDMIGATSRDYRHDDIQWLQENMKTNKFYNLFSDEEIQVNVKVGENKLPEVLGFMVNGHEVKAELISDKVMEVTVDGEKVEKGYSLDGISFTEVGKLRIESDGDEAYTLMTNVENKGLTFSIRSEHFGANKTRSTGIIGDVMGLGLNADLGENDVDGSGYLRNPDGSITKLGQNMAKALKSYQVDNVFDTDTDNGWIVYQGD